jgi:processive 1,2-diacylglycerol beta-glucosyltransferase
MKVLFLSVTAGQGHHQAARAAMEALSEHNIESMMLDTFEYINPVLSESIARGYLISTKFTPKVYGRIYRTAEAIEKNNAKISVSKLISSILSKKLVTFLREYNMDVIVCTHIFAAQIVSYLQSVGVLKAKTIGIVTDFTMHPFWEDTCLDYYITASPQLTYQALKKGIHLQKVKPIGVPIFSKFASKRDKTLVRSDLGIKDIFTVLVMSGSMGYGNVTDTIRQIDSLDMKMQIISVCGSNKALKQRIDNMPTVKKIYNYGYVDNVDVLMDASDCIVTKPGGLTVSESMAKCLPMLLVNPIPGQEDRNAEFLLNNGLAMKVSDRFPVDETVYQLLCDGWRRKHLEAMMAEAGKPHASEDLARLIIGL